MTLLSCVNEHFLKNSIDYEPVHLYKDVKVVWWGIEEAADCSLLSEWGFE
jgi:hypothetical protein